MVITLCACGCGEPTKPAPYTDPRYGWVKGEHRPYLPHHSKRYAGPEYIEDPETGCWEWQLHRGRGGYGDYGYGWRLRNPGRSNKAHRVYYEAEHGPIPEGLFIDHLCKNTCCVNPKHLEAVTTAENNRRARAILTPEAVREIRQHRPARSEFPQWGERFGVKARTIEAVVYGQLWRDIT